MTGPDLDPGAGRGPGHGPGPGHGHGSDPRPDPAHGPEDWGAYRREMWRRRGQHRWGRHGRPPRFFGCVFAIVFLIVAWAVITAIATSLAHLGPLPVVVAAVVVLALLSGLSGGFRRSARTLDALVEATSRVEAGDYTTRVELRGRGWRPVRQLVRGFNTMVERLARDEDQRRSLLNDVSHELRTPLTVIAGNLEAMVDGVHPADEAHLSAILEETRVMERLIDDLRTVALSEAGTLTLHPEPTDPDVLIEEVVRGFAGSAAASGVTVTAEVPSDLPIIDVDPVRLREVLSNLVGNAVRHTPAAGSVVVHGRATGGRLEIRVVDTGPGIDPSVLPHVFDRFVKGSGSTGSGLGLAIARHLVAAHGGTLDVEATGSAGTTFRVSLPLAVPTDRA
jgi:two-component system, OmpR family, sensor histidine kinase BaeS